MSRYAVRPPASGRWTGLFCELTVPLSALRAARDPEDMRRGYEEGARDAVLREYKARRDESLAGPSIQWMHPPGRVRYRWRKRTILSDLEVLSVTAAVYPRPALDRHTEGALP